MTVEVEDTQGIDPSGPADPVSRAALATKATNGTGVRDEIGPV
jgi:hypothetical protein